jgi:Spx/MgsR family transcriptional regulator
MVLYGLQSCDTVRRARAWLAERGVACDFHDFKKLGVPAGRLDAWIAAVGWQVLVNRQGSTWRKLKPTTQQLVVDGPSARALLLVHSSVIKRPVVEWPDGQTTVGFDVAQWPQRLRT